MVTTARMLSFLMRVTTFFLLLSGAAAALLAGGCADGIARGKAEREIAKMLPEILGPAESYSVKVDGKATEMLKGKVRGVQVTGVRVQPEGLPCLDRLEADVRDVVVDTKNHAILSAGKTAWSGWLDNAEITRLLNGRIPLLEEIQVSVLPGYVVASGKATYLGVTTSGSVRARPSVRKGSEIWMTPTRFEFLKLGTGVPAWAGQKVADIVNPVYTVPAAKYGISLTGIAAEKDRLRLDGDMDLIRMSETRRKR